MTLGEMIGRKLLTIPRYVTKRFLCQNELRKYRVRLDILCDPSVQDANRQYLNTLRCALE